jgi:hypothetical protein
MPPRARDRWLAMLLCLAVPGLGHLRTRRARGACWLAAAAVAACAPWPFGPPLWITLAVASAYDVARLPRIGSARPHVSLVYARGRVDLAMSLDLARSCESLWPSSRTHCGGTPSALIRP